MRRWSIIILYYKYIFSLSVRYTTKKQVRLEIEKKQNIFGEKYFIIRMDIK